MRYPMLLVCFLAVVTAGASAARGEDLDRRIPVQPRGLLLVDLDLGEEVRAERVSLEVRSHDADEVWVVADLAGFSDSAVKFRLESDEKTVRLYAHSGGWLGRLFGGPGVSVRIWVPRDFSLDLRCESGPISIEDINGDIRARTTDAGIDVRATEGLLKLRTRSGRIHVVETIGDVEVKSTEGSVEISWVTGSVDVRTGRGDIQTRHINGDSNLRTGSGEIEIREANGITLAKTEQGAIYASYAGDPEGRLETRRGSVVVAMPRDAGVALEASTRRGYVEIDDEQHGKEYSGKMNGGGSPLHIYTARGTIRVGRR